MIPEPVPEKLVLKKVPVPVRKISSPGKKVPVPVPEEIGPRIKYQYRKKFWIPSHYGPPVWKS